jgi:hypothetical protein
MPFPIQRPSSISDIDPVDSDSLWLRQKEDWATTQERMRHAQALYQVGEYSMFVLMWSLIDLQDGLVGRCQRCYGTTGTVQHRIADVYNQPTQNECPDCYGTTFEGGIRAKIVRPSIWADLDEKEELVARGVVHPERVSVETTWDFRMRKGDFILRADGSRWRVPDSPSRVTLRTGFRHPEQIQTSLTYHKIEARYEEHGTVAFLLPPVDSSAVTEILTRTGYEPRTFTDVEVINGPLIPPSLLD